jgi:hypothetical protein
MKTSLKYLFAILVLFANISSVFSQAPETKEECHFMESIMVTRYELPKV